VTRNGDFEEVAVESRSKRSEGREGKSAFESRERKKRRTRRDALSSNLSQVRIRSKSHLPFKVSCYIQERKESSQFIVLLPFCYSNQNSETSFIVPHSAKGGK